MAALDIQSGSDDHLLRIEQVARNLGVSTRTVRRLIDQGRLQAVRIGRSVRIETEDMCRFVSEAKLINISSLNEHRD